MRLKTGISRSDESLTLTRGEGVSSSSSSSSSCSLFGAFLRILVDGEAEGDHVPRVLPLLGLPATSAAIRASRSFCFAGEPELVPSPLDRFSWMASENSTGRSSAASSSGTTGASRRVQPEPPGRVSATLAWS